MSIMSLLIIEKTRKECFCLGKKSKLFWCSCAFVFVIMGCKLDRWEDLMEYMVLVTGKS